MKLMHIIKKEHGQAMVEFALVLPILLLFIGGIIDFGWIFYNQLAANNASREAARYIAIHYVIDDMGSKTSYTTNSAEAEAFRIIDEYTDLSFDISDIEPIVALEDDDDEGTPGLKVKVRFTGSVTILTPIISVLIDEKDGLKDGLYPITAESTMRVEQ